VVADALTASHLFVYGTLRPGLAPAEIAPVVAKLNPIGEGHLHGTLYHLGNYPGLVLTPVTGTVHGIVFQLPPDPQLAPKLLAKLDLYEGFYPNSPADSLFVRVLHPVTLATGELLDCWVYLFNQPPGPAPILQSGRYSSAEDTAPSSPLKP
jgi:gamma-glutamylcyclotransferase (GGCT)/AIG2-like uncharacterized protein YtfP